jgi:predicted Zn finger-like uncharacterized protein
MLVMEWGSFPPSLHHVPFQPMNLRIKCPACERQFKVSEELKGRTVECGGCEHRFKLDEEVLVARRGKFYPGETRKSGLDGFGRSQKADDAPVQFETAAYNQTQSVADFIPISPQQMVAATLGVGILAMTIVLLVLGTQPNGVLRDMEVAKRAVLAMFMVGVGVALVLYGCHHRRRLGYLVAGVSAAAAMTLAMFMPVPRTIEPGDYVEEPNGTAPPDEDREAVPRRKTAAEVVEMVGYGPMKRAIASRTTGDVEGLEFVTAVWVPVMEERLKFQIQKYLHRKTGTEERPSFYRREKGGLFVIDGAQIPLELVAGMVERFGRVEETYPEIRLIEVTLEGGPLLKEKPLMTKLSDKDHPAFYALNQTELDHIDLDRVDAAVKRLMDAEPRRFRIEITRRLIELMAEESSVDLKGSVARALATWSEPGDGAEKVVAVSALEIIEAGEPMPRSMLEFLVSRKSPEAVKLVEPLWVKEPTAWEPIMTELGLVAEDAAISHITSADRGIQQSAVRLLKRMGSQRGIESLRSLLDGADDEMKVLLQEAIDSIEAAP